VLDTIVTRLHIISPTIEIHFRDLEYKMNDS